MSAKESGNNGETQTHEEMTEIRELLKVLIQSQAKQAESLAEAQAQRANIQIQILEQAKSQENIQCQMLGALRSISSGTSNKPQEEKITDADDENEQAAEIEPKLVWAKYNPERNDLLVKGDCKKTIHRLYTVLHFAISSKREMMLIEEIVKLMPPEVLEYRTGDDDETALHLAAQYGNIEAVVLLVNKNPRLRLLLTRQGFTPLDTALFNVSICQKEVVEYLYSVTKDVDPSPFLGENGAFTLCHLIECNFYDIALCLVKKFPNLATRKSTTFDMCGLEMIVRRPFAFQSCAKLTWLQNLIYSLTGVKRLYNQKLMHQQAIALIKQILVEICKSDELPRFLFNNPNIMKTAIKNGIIEFVVECLEKYKKLIFYRQHGETMIEIAITERKEMIVNLIYETSDELGMKIDLVSRADEQNNTMLHYGAKLAPFAQLSLVSGAALQMQREVQWFKGIESILRESDRFARNKNGDTAQFIFTEAHKELVKEGQDWLKDTSGSCMIVGALIATVAFAAAFTVPGGNISDSNNAMNGTPIFLGQPSFTVFAVSDALALFSSITSVLMFLAIYTSRFAEMDFLKSLPQKLIFGLATLFISMVAILAAFGASLFIVVGSRFGQALIPITLFGCCPLALFAWLQLPLFVEMVRSTYWVPPFMGIEYQNYSFFSSQSDTYDPAKHISCLSNSTHQVFAIAKTTSSSSSWPRANCTLIATVPVPVQSGMDVYGYPWFAYTNVLHLTWPWKQAPYCKRNGCNERSNFPSFRDPDVPRRGGNIFLIVMGILIPTGIATYLCYIILRSKGFFSGRGTEAISWSNSSELVTIATGLDGSAIQSLPTIVIGESGRLPIPDNDICSICLSEYQPKETLKTMPTCSHCFHAGCIDVWLLLNITCPICRISPVSEKLL
ncbi:hypothetical protein MKW92_047370 [Papaver armeniacum]|nr:hypothetical protein MKW92_047370 [Papaver armeniacum]